MMLPLIRNSIQFSSEFNETCFQLKNKPLPFPGNIFVHFPFLEKSDFSALVECGLRKVSALIA